MTVVTGLLGWRAAGRHGRGARAWPTRWPRRRRQPVTVDWQPPVPGTEDALARVFADPRRRGANAQAVARMLAAGASLVDVRPAGEVVGLARGQFATPDRRSTGSGRAGPCAVR